VNLATAGRGLLHEGLAMEAAGVRIFAGGLHPASSARSLRAQPDGKVLITDGPYLETKVRDTIGSGKAEPLGELGQSGLCVAAAQPGCDRPCYGGS
jgi:hypothetical protein